MTFQIGQKVTVSAKAGTVSDLQKKTVLVRFEDGTERRFHAAMVQALPTFEPPCSAEEFFAPLPSSAAALRAKINR